MYGIDGCEEIEFRVFGAETRKAQAQNERLCWEQKVSDWQMNAWTLRTCDFVTVRDRNSESERYGG